MKAILILAVALVLVGCSGKESQHHAPPATDTTELHGNIAQVILKGTVEGMNRAGKMFILASDSQSLIIKVHETVFLAGGQEAGFENLTVGQAVTVAGVQNPGIVKADTCWLE